jgi:DNA-binding response OmpR family regulator
VLVLVAEDDRLERDLIAFRLECAGFQVRARATGPAALHAVNPAVCAVVLEQRLPGLDGLQVCRVLRADPMTVDLPILMVSDTVTEDEAIAAFAAGADDWLPEPAGIHQLRTRLTGLIARRRRHPDHVDTMAVPLAQGSEATTA